MNFAVEKSELYYTDYAFLKKMGSCYKLVKCNEVRRPGYEYTSTHVDWDGAWIGGLRGHWVTTQKNRYLNASAAMSEYSTYRVHENDEKLRNNICRAKNRILEYGLCNEWDYFCTLTLDKNKYDRFDLPAFIKHLGIWIQNANARTNAEIKYLLIPEQHKDGAWHLHGFFSGIPENWMQLFNPSCKEKLPPFIVSGIKKGRKLYECKEYRKRFGYCCFEPIRDAIAATMYMTKYVTKDISSGVRDLGAHLYYCSKGLKKAKVIAQGEWLDGSWSFGYTHTYGACSFYTEITPEILQDILDRIGDDPINLGDRKRGYKEDHGWRMFYDPNTGEIISPAGKEVHDYVTGDLWNAPDDRELLSRYETHADAAPQELSHRQAGTHDAASASWDAYRQMSIDDLYDLI